MKIQKIVLKNFACFYQIMNTKEVSIDFTKSDKRMNIILGPNGSGKTFLLSMLTPFSGTGNLDVRNDLRLIRKGKKGYKYFSCKHEGVEYVIEHYYTPSKDTHTIKSYFKKDGVELNPNGNVTSFLAVVEMELGLTQELLKVIRIGSNVQNIIKITPSKRKEFIASQLEDIEPFLSINKSASNYFKKYESILSYNIEQVSKLNIPSEETQEKIINEMEDSFERYKEVYDSLLNEVIGLEHDKSQLPLQDLKEIEREIHHLRKKKEKIEQLLQEQNLTSIHELREDLLIKAKEEQQEKEREQIKLSSKLDGVVNEISSMNSFLSDYRIRLSKLMAKNQEYLHLEENVKELRESVEQRKKSFSQKPPISQSEILQVISKLEAISNQIYQFILQLDNKTKETLLYILSNKDEYEGRVYLDGLRSQIKTQEDKVGAKEYFKTILQQCKSNSCHPLDGSCSSCHAYRLYKTLCSMTDLKEEDSTYSNEQFSYLEQTLLQCYQLIYQYSEVDMFRIATDLFQPNSPREYLIQRIKEGDPLYPKKELQQIYEYITGYDAYCSDRERLQLWESYLSHMKEEEKEIDSIHRSIEEYEIEKAKKEKMRDSYHREYESLHLELEELKRYIQLLEECMEYKDTYSELDNSIQERIRQREALLEYNTLIQTKRRELKESSNILEQQRKLLDRERDKLQRFHSLLKEQEELTETYNRLALIKRSTTVKEGIPLQYTIQYMQTIRSFANDILQYAFNGTRRIGEFVINERDFFIEYYVNENRIHDVKYASQGEESFLAIAISLAIMMESMEKNRLKYNVLLLDEIDGPLDEVNRQANIKILSLIMDRLHIEQCFIITHNDMFRYEQCGILSTNDNTDLSSYLHGTEIKIKKQ